MCILLWKVKFRVVSEFLHSFLGVTCAVVIFMWYKQRKLNSISTKWLIQYPYHIQGTIWLQWLLRSVNLEPRELCSTLILDIISFFIDIIFIKTIHMIYIYKWCTQGVLISAFKFTECIRNSNHKKCRVTPVVVQLLYSSAWARSYNTFWPVWQKVKLRKYRTPKNIQNGK